VVLLCQDHGNPTLLAKYRPIAPCNCSYQLINIIITSTIRGLTEKYAVLESSQHGFRGSRLVQLVIQKECWLLKQAIKQDTKLIRVDLDFKNAFNSAGHSSLWKLLEGFGVPDVSLLGSIYEHSTMQIKVGSKSSVAIKLDTETVEGSALFSFLFDLCINALLRLLDSTGIFHRVRGVPDWNHQAFADDLSLYVSSTEDANTLLDIVSEFQEWSGLKISIKKSLATDALYGKGETQRQKDASAESRERLRCCRSTPRRQSCRKHKTSRTYTATLLMICNRMTEMYPRPVTNSPIGGFSRDVRHAAETVVPITLSPNLELNAPNVSSPGFPMAFGTRAKSSRRSTVKLPSGS